MKQASLFLKAILEHNDVVVGTCGKRLYPIAAPAGVDTFPFITFEHSSSAQQGTKDGDSRIIGATFSVVAETALGAEEIADSIIPKMNAFCDDHSANTFANIFYDPEFVKEDEIYVPEIDKFIVRINIQFETV